MNGIWFFDDWMLERRDCLERVWGKPAFVKEIFTEFYPPGWDGYGGYPTAFYDERLGQYALYLIAFPGRESRDRTPGISAGEFQFRLLSDDPCNWPDPVCDPAPGPAWRRFDDVVVDQDGAPIWAHAVHSLAGTPLAARGYASAVLDVPRHLTWGGFSDDGVRFTVDRSGPWLDPGSDIAGDILWNREAGPLPALCAPRLRRPARGDGDDDRLYAVYAPGHDPAAGRPGPGGNGAVRHAAAPL